MTGQDTRELLVGVKPSLPVCHRQVRFYVLYVKPGRVHQRKFDPSGKEIEPNFSDTKKVNTGFLMSSYSECTDGRFLTLSSGFRR